MQMIRYMGVLLAAGLAWVVVSGLLMAMGLGRRAISIIGFLLLFILGPVLFALASGGRAADGRADPSNDANPLSK